MSRATKFIIFLVVRFLVISLQFMLSCGCLCGGYDNKVIFSDPLFLMGDILSLYARPEHCPEIPEILKFVLNVLKFQWCPEILA